MRRLRLQVPPAPQPSEQHNLTANPEAGLAFFGYKLSAQAPFIGENLDALRLPVSARAVSVLRGGAVLAPESAGQLAAGDTLYVLAKKPDAAALNELLAAALAPAYLDKRQFFGDFVLHGDAQMGVVAAQYNLPLPATMADMTLEAFLRN